MDSIRQVLQDLHHRTSLLLEQQGTLDNEVLELLFCLEQGVGDLERGPLKDDEADTEDGTSTDSAAAKADGSNTQGQAHFQCRHWRWALACFSDAAHACPREAVYHANMAAAALKLKEWHTALQAADRALHLSPASTKVQVRRAKALEGLGLFDKATTAWQQLVATQPAGSKSATGWAGHQARCARAAREGALAAEDEAHMVNDRPALPLCPTDTEALASQLETARLTCQVRPHSQIARAVLVECLILLGRLEDAGEAGEALAPGAHTAYLMAEIALRKGDPASAARIVEDCLAGPAMRATAPPAHPSAQGHSNQVPGVSKLTALQRRLSAVAEARRKAEEAASALHAFQSSDDAAADDSCPTPHSGQQRVQAAALQAHSLDTCEALCTTLQRLAPHSALLGSACCMTAQVFLEGPEGGAKSALQALAQAPKDEPCVMWMTARAEQTLGLAEAAFCTLRHLQATSPKWPGLQDALHAAAAAAMADPAHIGGHGSGSTGASSAHRSTSSSTQGTAAQASEVNALRTLGADRSMTATDLKKLHRGLALKHHPDKGATLQSSRTSMRLTSCCREHGAGAAVDVQDAWLSVALVSSPTTQ